MKKITLMFGLLLAASLAGAEGIHDAAKAGDLATVKKLLAESPFLRKSLDQAGRTPGTVAAAAGQIAVVEYLLGAGVKVDDASSNGRTMLHEACEAGKLDMVKLLVTKYRASLSAKDQKDWQPIHCASRKNPVEMLQFLLDQRADPNAEANMGATPLIMATAMKLQPQVALLVQRKADVNKADNLNRTPLHIAAKNKDKALVELLIKAGAKAGEKDKDGKTAMDEATAAGAPELVPLLEQTLGGGVNKRPGLSRPQKADKKAR